jgi:hypothetical protein
VAIKLKTSEDEEAKVYGNENFGIPKDYTKKQRFSALKLAFYVLAVVAICVTGYRYYSDALDHFLPEITFDRTNQPLVYSTMEEGIILKTQNGKSYEVGKLEQGENASSAVTTVSMGKGVFFIGESEEGAKSALCCYNVSTDEVTEIDSGVSEFKVDASGRFVLYKKGKTLMVSDMTQRYTVAQNVSDYYLSANNQAIIYYTDGGRAMYVRPNERSAKAEFVDSGITKVVSPKDTHTGIYYIKDSALYYKESGTEKTVIAENVLDAIMLGNSVYYTTEETYERRLGEFFTDDAQKSDGLLSVPVGDDYIKEIDGLSFFDEEEFNEDNKEYEKKLIRDEIRDYFRDTPIEDNGYSLYMYSEGDAERVDTNLYIPKLSYNSSKNIMLYKKYDMLSLEKMNLSEVESLEEALLFAETLLAETPDVDMHIVKERKKPYLAFEEYPTLQTEISLDGKYIYCIEEGEENSKKLIRYEVGTSSLKNKTVVREGVTDFALDGSDSAAVMVFNNNELSFYYDGKLTELSENSYRDFFFVDGTLFYYDDYDYQKSSGTLCSVRDGKITIIDTNVCDFNVRKYNAVSYVKKYSHKAKSGTLFIKEGKTIKRQDNYVTTIIN